METTTEENTLIAEHGPWKVRHLSLTLERLQQLWEKLSTYHSLFSDMTRGDTKNFEIILLSQDSFWMEVVDEDEELIGVMYLTNTQRLIDADVHIVFFDRKPAEKARLCQLTMEWIFRQFAYRRLTATVPSIYYAVIRLAKHIGFKEEGRKRESLLMGNKWVDEQILGILRSEVL
jgi:RimJ/RimL family protein N-acetyltransferase